MNEELLQDRIESRAREWDVAGPPVGAILDQGRRLRRRRRGTWVGGVAASVVALAVVAGATLGGTSLGGGVQEGRTAPGQAAGPVHVGPEVGPTAQGQWVGIRGVGLDVPADWDATLLSCPKYQLTEPGATWTMRGGPAVAAGDLCSEGWAPGVTSISFSVIDEASLEGLSGRDPREVEDRRTVDGAEYARGDQQCLEQGTQEKVCLAYLYFYEQDVYIGVNGPMDAATVASLFDSVRIVPGLEAPQT